MKEKPDVVAWVVVIVLGILAIGSFSLYDVHIGWVILGSVLALVAVFVAYTNIKASKARKFAQTNPEAYVQWLGEQIKKSDEEERKKREMQQRQEEERLATLPPCPICGSKKNVQRISTMNRAVSIAAVGLASSKIGKQYECTHCKHKW